MRATEYMRCLDVRRPSHDVPFVYHVAACLYRIMMLSCSQATGAEGAEWKSYSWLSALMDLT